MRKGIALITTLLTIVVLSLGAFAAAYFVFKDTQNQLAAKDADRALKAAEAGAQRALSRIKWFGNFSNFSGLLNGASYNVKISFNSSTWGGTLNSTGIYGGSRRYVSVDFIAIYRFSSFASRQNFKLGNLTIEKPFLEPTFFRTGASFETFAGQTLSFNGTPYNVTFVSKAPTLGRSVNLTPFVGGALPPFIPKVPQISYSSAACDLSDVTEIDGSFAKDSFGNILNIRDVNSDGQVVICSSSSSPLKVNGLLFAREPVTVVSSGSIDIEGMVGKRMGGMWSLMPEVAFVSKNGDIKVDAPVGFGCGGWMWSREHAVGLVALNGSVMLNNSISVRGRGNFTYNFLIYAGKDIKGNPPSTFMMGRGRRDALINVMHMNCPMFGSGAVNGTVMIAARGNIDLPNYNVLSRSQMGMGSSHENLNMLIWANGDINLGALSLATGHRGCCRMRWIASGGYTTLGILSNANLSISKLLLSGGVQGITDDDVNLWLSNLNSTSLAANKNVEYQLLSSFERQLDARNGIYNLVILHWRER